MPLFKKKSKCENELRVQVHFHANQAHCYRTDFTLRLDLKQRHKGLGNGLLTLIWIMIIRIDLYNAKIIKYSKALYNVRFRLK